MPEYMTAEDFLPYVRNGAELLNQTNPGWRSLIDRDRLHMGKGESCLLGQLYGHYSKAFEDPGLSCLAYNAPWYGFDIFEWGHPDSFYQYIELGNAWKMILER